MTDSAPQDAARDWPWAAHRALAVVVECYETPEWAVEAILDAEMMTTLVIDPCCGRGVLAEAAAERGTGSTPSISTIGVMAAARSISCPGASPMATRARFSRRRGPV